MSERLKVKMKILSQPLKLSATELYYVTKKECLYKNVVNFPAEFCPPLADPIGGFQVCKDWGYGGQFKVCEIGCNAGLRFSEPVPKFYTCGAEGFWRPTSNPNLPVVYPACSRKYFPYLCLFIRKLEIRRLNLLISVYRIEISSTSIQGWHEVPNFSTLQ